MTAAMERDTTDDLRDWESPSRLLRRYLSAGGMQALGALLCGLGFLVLVLGWWRISKESIVALQIPYLISGGIGGALLLGLGGILLVAHELRLDQRRLEVIEETLAELRDALLAPLPEDPTASPAATSVPSSNGSAAADGARFVVVRNGKRYHDPACAVAAGKDVETVTRDELGALVACRLCSPAG